MEIETWLVGLVGTCSIRIHKEKVKINTIQLCFSDLT